MWRGPWSGGNSFTWTPIPTVGWAGNAENALWENTHAKVWEESQGREGRNQHSLKHRNGPLSRNCC